MYTPRVHAHRPRRNLHALSSHRTAKAKVKSISPYLSRARHASPFILLMTGCPFSLHLSTPNSLEFTDNESTNMCLNDDEHSYETRTEIRNGRTYYTRYHRPHFGMSLRRRYGFGGPYYPSRYYDRPPTGGRYITAFAHPNRYSQQVGHPRSILRGGHSWGVVSGGYSQAIVPRGYVGGGHPEYSSGYGYEAGYQVGGHSVMPTNAAMVSLFFPLFPSLVPTAYGWG